jgi:hypothetical protein
VTGFTLVNANSDSDILTISNGSSFSLAQVGSALNIRTNTAGTIGSVVMKLTGAKAVTATESVAPYALFGDDRGNYNVGSLPAGSYTLSATPYSSSGGSGTAGTTFTISFTVTP